MPSRIVDFFLAEEIGVFPGSLGVENDREMQLHEVNACSCSVGRYYRATLIFLAR